MKKIFFLFSLLFSQIIFSQEMPSSVDDVIKWNFKVKYEKDCNEATIEIIVDQKDGWHIYTQEQPDGAVAMPTSFSFKKSEDYQLIGKVEEFGTKLKTGQFPEKIFPGDKAVFKQRIKILTNKNFVLELDYSFMACLEACFPPDDRSTKIKVKGTKLSDCVETNNENSNDIEGNNLNSIFIKLGMCEGFNAEKYGEHLTPVKIKMFNPTRNDYFSYTLSLGFEIDSVFGMYAFNNPKGLQSVFNLSGNENISKLSPVRIDSYKFKKNESDTIGYFYAVTLNQDIEIKDTSKIDDIKAKLNLFLFGCDKDFKNKDEISILFPLSESLDSGSRSENKSYWLIFILAFLGGLLALLTPCVFPMIPMTVTFFTKQSKTRSEGIRKAIIYALSIILIYVFLGVFVSAVFGETALNEMATNPYVNIGFFVLFVIFAISFLGAFEIRLPSSWVNKADKQADRGGLIGIFFMAFTLALVSFSCTGPIVGSVLVQSAQGGFTGPIIAMLGFSLALALPFGLFAAFPGWLNSMPQSGGWLNTVKVVLGFLELAFALKFLSNADLVKQWHLLEREVFLAIWIGIFIMLFIYLIGKIQLPHDSKLEKLSVGRGLFALVVISFIVYLIPGLFGAQLRLISGFPPPLTYSEAPYGIHGEAPTVDEEMPASTHAHGHGINVIRDYQDALDYAKKVNKPLLLDFTGWACVNCRRMEENVWADGSISPIMAEKFVIASLYVDDRELLPIEEQGKPMVNGKTMKTIGDKWMNLQIEKYKEVTQPMYVVLDHNENNISGKANYQTHGNVELFKEWLEFSLKQFEASQESKEIIPEFEIIE